MHLEDLDHYIEEVMKQAFGKDYLHSFPFNGSFPFANLPKKPQSEPEFFETDEYVYVKLPINEEQKKIIKIQHNQHHLYLLNYPEKKQQQKYIFPAPVRRKGTKTVFTDGILEMKFIKLKDLHYTEILPF